MPTRVTMASSSLRSSMLNRYSRHANTDAKAQSMMKIALENIAVVNGVPMKQNMPRP